MWRKGGVGGLSFMCVSLHDMLTVFGSKRTKMMYVTPTLPPPPLPLSCVTISPLHHAACPPWPRSSGGIDINRKHVENASVNSVFNAFNRSTNSNSHRLVSRRVMLRGVAAAVTGAAIGVGISIGYKVCQNYLLHNVTIM